MSLFATIGVIASPAQSQDLVTTPFAQTDIASTVKVASIDVAGSVVVPEASSSGLDVVVVAADGSRDHVAHLSVPGVQTRQWTGVTCVTGSGDVIAATFAPVEFLDNPDQRAAGAFLALIDTSTRSLVVADRVVAMNHNSLGCGAGDEVAAVAYDGGPDDASTTHVITVDARSGATRQFSANGRLHSPAPTGDSVYLANGAQLLRHDGAAMNVEHQFAGPVANLHANRTGGVDLLELGPAASVTAYQLNRFADGTEERAVVASGAVGQLQWFKGTDGANHVVDATAASRPPTAPGMLPTELSLDGRTSWSGASDIDDGELAVAGIRGVATVELLETALDSAAPPVLTVSGQIETFQQIEGDPVCAVAPNDINTQAVQPSPAQVEWAAHRAVRGELDITRPANWNNNGLSEYTPQGQFPRVSLTGGGRIPAQVLLGVLAQESNFWQANGSALPGMSSDPLIANYYGIEFQNGRVVSADYGKADCGYGVGQITDNMRIGDSGYTPNQQRMIATDYAANIAAAQQILASKWNELYAAGLLDSSTDPSRVENWYMPVWAYNSGYRRAGSLEGLGWQNNPANSDWRFDRGYFQRGDDGLADASRPSDWAYQERVLGFAETGLYVRGERAFLPVVGVLNLPRQGALSLIDRFVFCDSSNQCDENYYENGVEPVRYDRSFCTRSDRRCWWDSPLPFDIGSGTSENPAAYSTGAEPTVDEPYASACQVHEATLPDGVSVGASVVVVDNLPSGSTIPVGCAPSATRGTFTLTSATNMARADVKPIGGTGFNSHFWTSKTNWDDRTTHTTTGTWRPPASVTGWHRILVAIPRIGADTYQADYRIYDGTEGNGPSSYHRVVNQRWNENRWVDLGVFELSAGARVALSNVTVSDHSDGKSVSIAWDAVAFVPTSGPPDVAYVALGDSYTSGEGGTDYFANSDVTNNTANVRNACHRSTQAYSVQAHDTLRTSNSTFAFLACSGAVSQNLLVEDSTHWGEVGQLHTGWIDRNTTHVSIGIGGNDVGFSSILKKCLQPQVLNCRNTTLEGTSGPMTAVVPGRIDALAVVYQELIGEVRRRAPQARITLVGYPDVIFEPPALASACTGVRSNDRAWFAAMGDRLRTVMADAADQANNVTFVDLEPVYDGHEACPRNAQAWINSASIQVCGACATGGEGREVALAGSFHPNDAGHTNAAPAISSGLTGPDPSGGDTDVVIAVSCLAGNGRIDVNLVNNTDETVNYRIILEGLSPRARQIQALGWWRQPFTGRPDGDLDLTIRRNGVTIYDQPVTVACDTDPPSVSPIEVQYISTCVSGNGYVLFQFVNPDEDSTDYVIHFQGVANRSTRAQPAGASFRAVSGRPDGTYAVTVFVDRQPVRFNVDVDCD